MICTVGILSTCDKWMYSIIIIFLQKKKRLFSTSNDFYSKDSSQWCLYNLLHKLLASVTRNKRSALCSIALWGHQCAHCECQGKINYGVSTD